MILNFRFCVFVLFSAKLWLRNEILYKQRPAESTCRALVFGRDFLIR